QPSSSGALPPGATLVSGTVPSGAAPVTAAPAAGTLSKNGDAAQGVNTAELGLMKGAVGGLLTSAGETIQGLPWVGKKILSPEAMQAEREYFRPGSAAEK